MEVNRLNINIKVEQLSIDEKGIHDFKFIVSADSDKEILNYIWDIECQPIKYKLEIRKDHIGIQTLKLGCGKYFVRVFAIDRSDTAGTKTIELVVKGKSREEYLRIMGLDK